MSAFPRPHRRYFSLNKNEYLRQEASFRVFQGVSAILEMTLRMSQKYSPFFIDDVGDWIRESVEISAQRRVCYHQMFMMSLGMA